MSQFGQLHSTGCLESDVIMKVTWLATHMTDVTHKTLHNNLQVGARNICYLDMKVGSKMS